MKAVNENLQGKGPSQIFVENGFDLMVIESDKPKKTLKRWRKGGAPQKLEFKSNFWGVFYMANRASSKSAAEKAVQAALLQKSCPRRKSWRKRKRIKYLEAEMELLKKLEALERQAKKRNWPQREVYCDGYSGLQISIGKFGGAALPDRGRQPQWLIRLLENVEQHAIRVEQDYEDYLLLKSIYGAHRGKIG